MITKAFRNYTQVLSNVGAHVTNTKYAVRGAIPIRGQEIAK